MWRTFWMGDAMEGGSEDPSKGFAASFGDTVSQAARGVTAQVPMLISTAIGVWLMLTRLVFDSTGSMANSDHLVGALVVTFSIIALAEVARQVRFINIAFGAWLIAAPWLLTGVGSTTATLNSIVCGILLIVLALPKGRINNTYAGWDRYIV